jgi:hypothetical protein
MSVESNKAYRIGYKKPPKATRWQKGKSGNPSGRPKRPDPESNSEADPGKVLQSIDNEEIVVTIDGKRMLMKKAEVHFRQLFAKAIKGDLKAARLIANLAAEYFGPDAEGPSDARFIVVPDQKTKRAHKSDGC